jgi:outer membrane protein OmpA-like peptidoglycan-associated protein
LTRFKWLVGVLLLLALLVGWWTGGFGPSAEPAPGDATRSRNVPVDGKRTWTPAPMPTTGAAPAAAIAGRQSSPTLTLERRGDGQIVVSGTVADSATRDQWLNAIRIGAQGAKVNGTIAVAAVATAAPWSERLRQLTALTADRRLDSVRLENDRIILRGPAVAGSYRRETEQLFRAQLPEPMRVEFQPSSSVAATSREVAKKEAAREAAAKDLPREAVKEAPKEAAKEAARKEGSREEGSREAGSREAGSREAGSREPAKEDPRETGKKEPPRELPKEASRESAREQSTETPGQAATDRANGVSREPAAKGAPPSLPGTASSPGPPSVAGSDNGAIKSTAQPTSSSQAAKAASRCPARLDRLAASVYFRTDSVSIGEADRDRLATLGRCLKNRRVSVIGHADRRQSNEYNLALSRRRAQAVADIIRSNAPSTVVVATTAAGASEAAETSRREPQQRSRRVEIRLR